MQDFTGSVAAIYAAWVRRDIAAIVAQLAPDVAWEQWPNLSAQAAGVPWLVERRGRESVLEFFKVIGTWTFHDFQVTNILAGGNQVAALCRLDAEVPAGGARLQDEEIHLWTFGPDGLVTHFRHYADTGKHIAAARTSR